MILWDYMNILLPTNLSSIGFSIHWYFFFFLPEPVIMLLVVKWWFSNSIIPSICLNWHYFVKKFSSSHLYPWLWTHWFPFVVIHYYHYSLWSSSYPKFSQWESLPASPIVLWMCLHCLITSLLSEREDAPGSLYTCPMPGISHFSKRAVVFIVVSSSQQYTGYQSPGEALMVSMWFQLWGVIWSIFLAAQPPKPYFLALRRILWAIWHQLIIPCAYK